MVGDYADPLRWYRDWSKELAYAFNALLDSSESGEGSEAVDEVVLCMEKRLDCELDGVNVGRVDNGSNDDCGRALFGKTEVRGEGVVP